MPRKEKQMDKKMVNRMEAGLRVVSYSLVHLFSLSLRLGLRLSGQI